MGFFFEDVILEASPVIDAFGRVFVLHVEGLTAVDVTQDPTILWFFGGRFGFIGGIAVRDQRVFYGSAWDPAGGGSTFYCLDVATGKEVWREESVEISHMKAPVIDESGNVFFADSNGVVYARRVEDGEEVWTTDLDDTVFAGAAYDDRGLLARVFTGLDDKYSSVNAITGQHFWTFDTDLEVRGIAPVENGRTYIGSRDRNLYCVNTSTGAEVWRLFGDDANRGATAIGHSGTIYTGATVRLIAIDPNGKELWHFETGHNNLFNAPIVDGAETIYFCAQTAPNFGDVIALNPDGTELWRQTMPHQVSASPMLAPDGTLYILCRDQFLYAFRDPAGDLNHDQVIDLGDFSTIDQCLTRPRIWGQASLNVPGCELLDFNSDWDVDLHDYAAFQNANGTTVGGNK